MIKLTSDQINDIAQSLDMGFCAYVHKKSGEIITIPNELELFDIDMESWEEDIEKLNENFTDYLEIEKWFSSWSYDVMVDFAENHVGDERVQKRLLNALNRNKPFRRFKYVIDNEGYYRSMWFHYKSLRQEEFIRKQLDFNDWEDEVHD